MTRRTINLSNFPWQFNEPWPAIGWAIVDYYNRPKLAYERLSNWYNPLLISLKFPVGRCWQPGEIFSAKLWAINDSLHAYTDCEVQVRLADDLIHSQRLDLPADSSCCVGSLTYRLTRLPGEIFLSLSHETEILAQNSYDLSWADESNAPFLARLRRQVADWVLR